MMAFRPEVSNFSIVSECLVPLPVIGIPLHRLGPIYLGSVKIGEAPPQKTYCHPKLREKNTVKPSRPLAMSERTFAHLLHPPASPRKLAVCINFGGTFLSPSL